MKKGSVRAPLLTGVYLPYTDRHGDEYVHIVTDNEAPVDQRHMGCELVIMTRARYESLRLKATPVEEMW